MAAAAELNSLAPLAGSGLGCGGVSNGSTCGKSPSPGSLARSDLSPQAGRGETTSFVKLRRHFQRVTLGLVVVDPQRRLVLRQAVRDLLHRRQRLLLADVIGGHAAVVPIALEVNGVAREDQFAGLRQFDEQRLMP